MATRRFCDICDKELKQEDDKPFIRSFLNNANEYVYAHVMMLNKNQHVVTDICNKCKVNTVSNGEIPPTGVSTNIATLQPSSAMSASGSGASELLSIERSSKENRPDVPDVDKISVE